MIKNLRPSIAEAGKIKIGRKGAPVKSKATGKTFQPPQKIDHFLITTNQRGEDGNLVIDEEAMDACVKDKDGKIRVIPIALHSDVIDEVFPTRYALYEGRKATCSGDGESNIHGGECPCPRLKPEFDGTRCKPNGILHCSIIVPGRATIGSVHKWRTTSIISIQRMVASLEQVVATVGALRGVPLNLVVDPVQVSPGGAGTKTVFCCHIECRERDIEAVMQRALRESQIRRAIGSGFAQQYKGVLQLPGINESPEEQSEVSDEFYQDATADAELITVTPTPSGQTKEESKAPTQADILAAELGAPQMPEDVYKLMADITQAEKLEGGALLQRAKDASAKYPQHADELRGAWDARAKQLKPPEWKDPGEDIETGQSNGAEDGQPAAG